MSGRSGNYKKDYVRPVAFHVGMARLEKLGRLLAKIDKVHESLGHPMYSQCVYSHSCGTPACALGHYTMIAPSRWSLSNVDNPIHGDISYKVSPDKWNHGLPLSSAAVEFCISLFDAQEIFSAAGCNRAHTAKEASRFILGFVKRRREEREAARGKN